MAHADSPSFRPLWRSHPRAFKIILLGVVALALAAAVAFVVFKVATATTKEERQQELRQQYAGTYRQPSTGHTLSLDADGTFDFSHLMSEEMMPNWEVTTKWHGPPVRRPGDAVIIVPIKTVDFEGTDFWFFLRRGKRLYPLVRFKHTILKDEVYVLNG